MSNTGIIILAAGSSSRMGSSKQLLEIHGTPLLLRTINTALQSGAGKTVVVLGAHEESHRSIIENREVNIVANPSWERGMGSSIKCGLHELLKIDSNVEQAIIMVCDQPLLTIDILKKLISKKSQSNAGIIASSYSSTMGVPVLFDKKFFEQIMKMPDDHGAKKIITQNQKDVETVEFPSGDIDLDTPEDLKKFNERHS